MSTPDLPPTDTRLASPELASILTAYFASKSRGDADDFVTHYAPQIGSHSDAVLGMHSPDWDANSAGFHQMMPNWNGGISYATRALGDEDSAVVFVTDGPELFGQELRTIAAVDFADGQIVRFVDYWDGRQLGRETVAAWRAPAEGFATSYGEDRAKEVEHSGLDTVIERLIAALTSADLSALEQMLAPDVVLEDLSLQVTIRGASTVLAALTRALPVLPYGAGVSLHRVLGSERSGGFEWTNTASQVPRGITAIALDPRGRILELTSIWDASLVAPETLREWSQAIQRD